MTNTMPFHGSILSSAPPPIHSSSLLSFSNGLSATQLPVNKSKLFHNYNIKANVASAQLRSHESRLLAGENSVDASTSRGQGIETTRPQNWTKPKSSNRRSRDVYPKPKEFIKDSSVESQSVEQELTKRAWATSLYGDNKEFDCIPWPERRSAIAAMEASDYPPATLDRIGEKLQIQDLNCVLRHFGRMKKWQEACLLFDWMEKHGKVSAASYTSYITLLGKGHLLRKALELYRDLKDEHIRSNVFVCNAMLKCLVSSGRVETSIKLFEQMKEGGLNPDIVTYSTLLAGCVKTQHGYSKALNLFEEFKRKGLKLDSVMYGSLLAVCASHGLDEEAEAYFQQMKNEGQSINEFHYSSLLNVYAAKGKHEKAEILVDDMKSAGLVPNKVVLNSLLKVYARSGLFEKAKELFAQLEALGHALDEMPYCLLMDAFAKAGKIEEAQKIFDEMKVKGIKSDVYSYSTMISAYSKNGEIEQAKKLAEELENVKGKYDLVMLNTLLKAYARGGDMECVMQTLNKMDSLLISPDQQTFNILIAYFCKEKLYDLARRTLEDMQARGFRPTEHLCSPLISGLGGNGATKEALNIYNQLKLNRAILSKTLHEKMLNILIAGKMLKDAYEVMKGNAKSISKSSLERFVIAFARTGHINTLIDVFREFHNSGYKIEQGIFNIAFLRYIEQGKKQELLQFLKWMNEQGYVVDSSTRNSMLEKLQDSDE
eukprot:Gb_14466 [translate_table: standard]